MISPADTIKIGIKAKIKYKIPTYNTKIPNETTDRIKIEKDKTN